MDAQGTGSVDGCCCHCPSPSPAISLVSASIYPSTIQGGWQGDPREALTQGKHLLSVKSLPMDSSNAQGRQQRAQEAGEWV